MNIKAAKAIKKRIAKERIDILLHLARDVFDYDVNLARLYVGLAFTFVKRFKVRLSFDKKYSFCRKCFVPWIDGKTVKHSIADKGRVKIHTYECLSCGYTRRYIERII